MSSDQSSEIGKVGQELKDCREKEKEQIQKARRYYKQMTGAAAVLGHFVSASERTEEPDGGMEWPTYEEIVVVYREIKILKAKIKSHEQHLRRLGVIA